jgi:hypothetical protein
MDGWHLPPPRVLVGIAVTVLAVAVLGVRACSSGGDGAGDAAGSTTAPPTTAQATEDAPEITTSSIAILPDWYPKQSSRYSDREPVVTVTTLPPTTSTTTTEPEFDSSGLSDRGDND